MTVCITGLQRTANWRIRLCNLKHIHSQRFLRKASSCRSCTVNTDNSFEVREMDRKMMLAADPLLIALTDSLNINEGKSQIAQSLF